MAKETTKLRWLVLVSTPFLQEYFAHAFNVYVVTRRTRIRVMHIRGSVSFGSKQSKEDSFP